jgi:hypothetical protein
VMSFRNDWASEKSDYSGCAVEVARNSEQRRVGWLESPENLLPDPGQGFIISPADGKSAQNSSLGVHYER